jgi:PAS domain S-box-containing protein
LKTFEAAVFATVSVSPTPIALLSDRGRLRWANEAWARADERLGLAPSAPPAVRFRGPVGAPVRAALRRVLSGAAVQELVEGPHPADPRPDSWWRFSLLRAGEAKGLMLIQVDLTDEHRARARLDADSKVWGLLAAQSLDALMLFDGQGQCVWASPSSATLLGRSMKSLVGRSLWSLAHAEGRRQVPPLRTFAALKEGQLLSFELLAPRKGGPPVRLELRARAHQALLEGAPGYLIVGRDVSERHQAERQMHWKQAALRAAELDGHLGFFGVYPGTQRWGWTPSLFLLHGLEAGETPTAEAYLARVAPEDRPAVARALRSKGAQRELTYRYQLPDGTVRTLALTAHLTPQSERLGVIRDITEKTSLRRDVSRLMAERGDLMRDLLQARERERLIVSQDLHDHAGSAMTGLLLRAQQLELEQRPHRLRQLARTLATQTRSVLSDVRDIARTNHPAYLDHLPLAVALQRLTESFHGLSKAVIALELATDLPEHLPPGLLRIAQESLTNAVRHARASRIVISIARKKRDLVLEVRDDGRGFREGKREGLGLSGLRLRVEALGGRARVTSTPGQGTTVTVTIPVPARAQAWGLGEAQWQPYV